MLNVMLDYGAEGDTAILVMDQVTNDVRGRQRSVPVNVDHVDSGVSLVLQVDLLTTFAISS